MPPAAMRGAIIFLFFLFVVGANSVQAVDGPPPIDMVVARGADEQDGGPQYDFRVGRFEVRNDQFAAFLNDALANSGDERAAYLFFDADDGQVFIGTGPGGQIGTDGAGTLLFDPGIGGRLRFDGIAYVVVDPGSAAHPVVGVSWYGAAKFCNWLTLHRGMPATERVYTEGPSVEAWHSVAFDPAGPAANLNGFRLPMDEGAAAVSPYNEWYKAASRKSGTGGFGSVFGFGRDTLANADANFLASGDPFEIGATPVGFFNGVNKLANNTTFTRDSANGYRLYDLSGNVAEWVHEIDLVGEVIQGATRGGHFTHPADFAALRTDAREALPASSAWSFVGFRVAQSLTPVAISIAQDEDQVRAAGMVGGPFDRETLSLRLGNDAGYTADDLTITISPPWLVVDAAAPVWVPPNDTAELSLILSEGAEEIGVSPTPPGSLVLVSGLDVQEGGPTHDYWISTTEVTNDQFAVFLNDARTHKSDARGAFLYHQTTTGRVFLHDEETAAEGSAHPTAGIILYDAAVGRIRFQNDRYEVETGFGQHPVVGVSWYGAVKYCNWLTVFAGLPPELRAYAEGAAPADWHPVGMATADWEVRSVTEAERRGQIERTVGYRLPMDGEVGGANAFGEWYKAASATRDSLGRLAFGARYGFGREALLDGAANFAQSGDTVWDSTTDFGFFDGVRKLADGATATRGSDNAYSLWDACGNAAEWTQDFFAHDDPTLRATRGGSWRDAAAAEALTTTGRVGLPPESRNGWTGFRVVRGTGHVTSITLRDNIADQSFTKYAILDLREPLSVTPEERNQIAGLYCESFSGRTFSYTIHNASASEMPWSVSVASAGDWLAVDGPTPGSAAGMVPAGPDGSATISVRTMAAADALPPGEHTGTITFTNTRTGQAVTREVRLDVAQPVEVIAEEDNPPAHLTGVWGGPFETAAPFRYWFGRRAEAQTDCPPRYDVRVVDDWLTVEPGDPDGELAGPLPAEAIQIPFDVSINDEANLLGVGEHNGRIRFSYEGETDATPATPIEEVVRLTITDPIRIEGSSEPWDICCERSVDSLPSRSFTLTNLHGSLAAPVEVETDVDWLTLDAEQFTVLPGGARAITATLNDNALLPHGQYTGTVRVRDLLTGHVQTLAVRLTLVESLTLSPQDDFQAAGRAGGTIRPRSWVYRLTNVPDGEGQPIAWRAAGDQPWVLVDGGAESFGLVEDGDSAEITVSIDPSMAPSLPAGATHSTFDAAVVFDDLTNGETLSRGVSLTWVRPQMNVEQVSVGASDAQPAGPAYAFRIGRYDVTNAEFVAFLNDAMADLGGPRGRNLFFESTTGDVYVNSSAGGEIGPDREMRSIKVFSPSASGQIEFAEGTYRVRTSPVEYSLHPVTGVSWLGAVKFCNWLSLDQGVSPSELCYGEGTDADLSQWRPTTISKADWQSRDLNDAERDELVTQCRGFRLPMDDGYDNVKPTIDAADDYNEWYKAAAWNEGLGRNTVFGFGRDALDGADANFRCSGDPYEDVADCTVGAATPASYFDGTKKGGGFVTRQNANGFGLFDMTGNVHQWMQDRYAPPAGLDRRALRGGSWNDPVGAESLRNASRPMFALAGSVSNQIGFRVVRVLPTPTGDANEDGVVDAADWGELANCLQGPEAAVGEECTSFDFDLDARVDLRDAASMQERSSPTADGP